MYEDRGKYVVCKDRDGRRARDGERWGQMPEADGDTVDEEKSFFEAIDRCKNAGFSAVYRAQGTLPTHAGHLQFPCPGSLGFP